jgi:hypothetical protein
VTDTLDLQDDLQEVPIKIIDTMTKRTRTKNNRYHDQKNSNESHQSLLCKVQWSHHSKAEATWEKDDALREEYPQLFEEHSES